LQSNGRTQSIAFEPDPGNFAWLSRNLALNPGLKVTAVQMAVGDADGQTVPFDTAKAGHNLWARVGGLGDNEHAASRIEVPTTTLDSYIDKQGISAVPITLIDVEGYELRVIEGMSKGIAARRYESVMVEFHPWAFQDASAEARRMADRFLSAGYAGYRFRHYSGSRSDKDADYYRQCWDGSLLAPATFDALSSWEHYLFVAGKAADAEPGAAADPAS
jgi:FkbM family methyltransferase